jgi:integrase
MDSIVATALVPVEKWFTDIEDVALAGFLAGYRGSTREAYALDLRQFTVWCANHKRRLFEVHRVDIECFGRELEARGRARATIARRLCTIAGFYRYAEEEGLIAHSPAIHVRRPRLDYESHATGLDRNELGALLVAAGLSSSGDRALVSLLALNGLRVSEALGADINALGLERGHRTLTVTCKGGKVVTMPLAPRVARALDLAIAHLDRRPFEGEVTYGELAGVVDDVTALWRSYYLLITGADEAWPPSIAGDPVAPFRVALEAVTTSTPSPAPSGWPTALQVGSAGARGLLTAANGLTNTLARLLRCPLRRS